MAVNERKTENIVRTKLRSLGYNKPSNGITIEEQKSEIADIKRMLSKASKSQNGNAGYPEFIISNKKDSKFLIVIECKADVKKHESPQRDKPIEYAVDGVLHYVKHLANKYTVLAVAVSGSTEKSSKVSNFIVAHGGNDVKPLTNESGNIVDSLISFDDYYRLSSFDPSVAKKRHDDLIEFSKDLHQFIWTKAKISEEEKPLLVAGTLIALMNHTFMATYDALPSDELQDAWISAIKKQLDKAKIPQAKKDTMFQPYTVIAVHPNLAKPDSNLAKEYPDGVFKKIISDICENVWPFINVYHDFDVVGQFYGEFLKYSAGDKKSLGIVLTPRHVAELFSMLANVTPDSKVLDICAGTGGFLISAMQLMLSKATTERQRTSIKKTRLIGIENNPKMFALAVSNMMLRGDGKANLHQSSCFDEVIIKAIKRLKPTVGMLNPPYAQGKSDAELRELKFVQQMLECLTKGSQGIAIVPISCAITPDPIREELMREHTLEAVMSMPQELFQPAAGTVPCVMVWTAKVPHKQSNRDTWFGYWRDDGFVKTKHKGRVDLHNKWPAIRDHWVDMYRNRKVNPVESVMKKVTAADEWCVEAYMETDYSHLSQQDFEKVVRDYAIFKLMGSTEFVADKENHEVVESQ